MPVNKKQGQIFVMMSFMHTFFQKSKNNKVKPNTIDSEVMLYNETEKPPSKSCQINPKNLLIWQSIGNGSFGTVYKGKWNGMEVAIKKIEFDYETYDECKREKQIMQKLRELNAPNVVKFYGYSVDDPNYFIVMEFMRIGSLAYFIQNQPPFDLNLSISIMKDIATGVAFLHQYQIVHRDLKSPNVLLDENMQAKLCDFGFAKFIDQEKEARVGTPQWMAPEITKKEIYTDKADIFSLVTVFWELTAHKMPHELISPVVLLTMVSKGYRETIPENCPPPLAELITWGWKAKPEERPNAQEVLEKLNTIQTLIPKKRSP